MKDFFYFFNDLYSSRRLLWDLTKKDFKQRYLGSLLGILWAFIQPAATIIIFFFVFQVGFKVPPTETGVPFILWLMSGMLPWFFFSDALSAATTSISDNSFLVKKIVFRVSLLPIVQIISTLIIHLFFMSILILMYLAFGFPLSIYYLQLFYYLTALSIFLFGLSLLSATFIIFLKDVGQIITMFLQFGFWATPVFWSYNIIPEQYQYILKINPLFYIIEGYRNSLIYHKWFWEIGYTNIWFWLVTITLLIASVIIFKKLRPHFADVL